jgi:hypothetical protein
MINIKQLRSRGSDEASPFTIAMAEWANAKAALARNVAIPNQGDDCAVAEMDAIRAAEWKLLRTPAGTLWKSKSALASCRKCFVLWT